MTRRTESSRIGKNSKIITIDCQYLAPEFAAAYLMIEGDRAAFIETNTSHSVPRLLKTLAEAGMTTDQVQYVIITHVHLDHAGGASNLMEACPHATLLAHPRAARHMMDPAKLIASAKHVYGEETFEKLYGEITPIPGSRVQTVADGEELKFGERTLRFLYTRGHANHHMCIHDSGSNGIFTGDAFGLRYPALQNLGLSEDLFIFPTTSPTDFDAAEAQKSIDLILQTKAERAYLTHYGELEDLGRAALQLREHLDFSSKLVELAVRSAVEGPALERFCQRRLREHYRTYFRKRRMKLSPAQWDLLKLDLDLNGQGLAVAAEKLRSKPVPH